MKKSFVSATLVALTIVASIGALAQTAAAQQPGVRRASTTGGVAIIDLSYIFKNHARFQAQMEQLKKEAEQQETTLRAQRDGIRTMLDELKQYTPGTTNYKNLEAQITQKQADLQVQVQLQKREFVQREAKVYFATYREISQAVAFYCKSQGIDLVIRFNGDTSDGSDPSDVMKELNKTVVYNRPEIDITPIVLNQLNAQARVPATTPR